MNNLRFHIRQIFGIPNKQNLRRRLFTPSGFEWFRHINIFQQQIKIFPNAFSHVEMWVREAAQVEEDWNIGRWENFNKAQVQQLARKNCKGVSECCTDYIILGRCVCSEHRRTLNREMTSDDGLSMRHFYSSITNDEHVRADERSPLKIATSSMFWYV